MSGINDTCVVKQQYATSNKLNTRISIHSKYSTKKMGFGNWIVSNYKIDSGMRVLELGCGTGDMWKNHMNLVDTISELVLTDFSEGMLEATKALLGYNDKISYKVVDIQNIPFEDNSFDVVIANMMLYHVPDMDKGLSEVRRVLKNDGKFYCATYGENGIVQYISGLLGDYGVSDKVNKSFTLQNGKNILLKYFNDVCRLDYEDSLVVTEVEDMLDYIYSLTSMSNISNVLRSDLKEILKNNMIDGVLKVPKEYGMYVSW